LRKSNRMSVDVSVVSVNLSEKTGTIKQPVGEIQLDAHGVAGDAHAGPWHRQVSLLSLELIDEFSEANNRPIKPGEFAENITLKGIDLRQVAPLDCFHFGDVRLEVTQIGKKCHGDACAIFQEVGACVMPKNGLFARVLHGGALRDGDTGCWTPWPLRIDIVTLSDRAAAGHYKDRSGPAIAGILADFFDGRRWHTKMSSVVLPDDTAQLQQRLEQQRDACVDVVFTTGGTGIGPRDIAPDVTAPLCTKLIPGIMELIRTKYGAEKPAAALSRGVAGVMESTLVFNLPGSTKAVQEYLVEILKNLEHLIFTLHGIDRH